MKKLSSMNKMNVLFILIIILVHIPEKSYTQGYTGGAGRVILYSDSPTQPARDAFQRFRTSNPETLFDSKTLNDNQPLIFDDQQTSGSGTTSTFNTNRSSVTLETSNLTIGTRVRQTFKRINYQPGKSQLVILTGILGNQENGTTKRIGLYDANNGLFFEQNEFGLGVVRRTNTTGTPIDNFVFQSDWNLDKMDGTGASNIYLDVTKTQIFVIDFQWLGVGAVRFGVSVNGVTYYVHQMKHANNLDVVYMSTPNLPVRYEISNSGTGPASSLEIICATVISEGGRQGGGIERAIDRGSTAMVTLNNASVYPVVSIRLKSTHLGSLIQIKNISVVCNSNTSYRWVLLLNPTVVGTALSFSSVANSSLEANTTSLNVTTVTGGTPIASGYAQSANEGALNLSIDSDFAIGSNIAGTHPMFWFWLFRDSQERLKHFMVL